MQEPKMELKTINVTIGTPYLYQSLDDVINKKGILEVLKQSVLYGYDPDNLSNTNLIITPGERIVRLHSLNSSEEAFNIGNVVSSDLVIVGNTEGAEEGIKLLAGDCGINTGSIIARYSIFYGGPSQYTGNEPGDVGYSLDIPKDTSTVKKMLNDDYFLESILERNEDAIVDSIDRLNKNLDQPILITSYLPKALEITQEQRKQLQLIKC
jgi:hypothetical protein